MAAHSISGPATRLHSRTSTVAVVGASLAGLHAANSLRERGFEGKLVVIGDEPHAPYDRPPLSKQLLRGESQEHHLALPLADEVDAEWILGTAADGLDMDSREVRLDDGSKLGFDGLVIATGTRARRLGTGGLDGVHTLRTLDDGKALAAELNASPGRVVVIGGGFIGTEIAASCRGLGLDVTVLEALEAPLAQVLGAAVGERLAATHRDRGVDVRTDVTVTGFQGSDRIESVRLSDGSVLPADVLVVAVGVEPAVEWLRGSGLPLDDGVLCDDSCLVAEGVVAAGDVARWPNPRFGELRRVEHWDNAIRQAEHAAGTLLGDGPAQPYAPVPWVWSDQYETKLQLVGSPQRHDQVELIGDDQRWIALYRSGDRLVAAFASGRTRDVMRLRNTVGTTGSWNDALTRTMSSA